MCLGLLPTSLAQHSHSYVMDSEIPELDYHLHTVFCIGHTVTLKPSLVVNCLVLPPCVTRL